MLPDNPIDNAQTKSAEWTLTVNGKVSAFVELVADLTLAADSTFNWRAVLNAGVQFDALLELSAKLFEWTQLNIVWISLIPIVYELFMAVELAIITRPLSVSAGVHKVYAGTEFHGRIQTRQTLG